MSGMSAVFGIYFTDIINIKVHQLGDKMPFTVDQIESARTRHIKALMRRTTIEGKPESIALTKPECRLIIGHLGDVFDTILTGFRNKLNNRASALSNKLDDDALQYLVEAAFDEWRK